MGKHFFITGGSGQLGDDLVPRILRRIPDSTITLLIRAESDKHALERLRSIARRISRDEGVSDAEQRIDCVSGDVLHDGCGLTEEQRKRLIGRVTHIIHGAATIRFDHPLEEARAVNLGGTRHLLDFARRSADEGRLERFVYIGTSSVSGNRAGRIREHELEMGQGFFNTYEQSKCESERLVRNHFGILPICVVRPSIVIGDSRSGRTTSFNVIYIPLRLLHRGWLKAIPGSPTTLLDLVPVDWVNDVMIHIMERNDSNGKVYHLTAGPSRAAALGELVEIATSYFEENAPLPEPRSVRFVNVEEFARTDPSSGGRNAALQAQLATLLPYISVNRLFDSQNTDAALAGSGIAFPQFEDYADRILGYCLKTNWGKTKDEAAGYNGPSAGNAGSG